MSARTHGAVDTDADPNNPVALPYAERARVLAAACSVRRDRRIFLVAGRSLDGRTVYIDERVPLLVAGIDTNRTVPLHELGELLAMNNGLPYDDDGGTPNAHFDVANPLERREVERLAPDDPDIWAAYCAAFKPIIAEIDADKDADEVDLPEGFDMRPIEQDPAGKGASPGNLRYKTPALKSAWGSGETNPMTTPAGGALSVFVPISKVDAKQRLVYGTLASEVADKSSEIMDYASTKPEFEAWSGEIAKASDGKSVGNVRAMHGNVAAGKLTSISFDDKAKAIEACAKIVDDAEWDKVEQGVYTGFSMGGAYLRRWKDEKDDKLTRYTARPVEVSLVDNPCIPTATFAYIKQDGTQEVRKFVGATAAVEEVAPAVTQPSNEEVAARAGKMAKDAGSSSWGDYIAPALKELLAERTAAAEATHASAAKTAAETGAAKAAEADPGSAAGDVKQVWQAKDGSAHATKAAAKAHNVKLDAEAAAAKAAAPALDALKGVTTALDKASPPAATLDGVRQAWKTAAALLEPLGISAADYAVVDAHLGTSPSTEQLAVILAMPAVSITRGATGQAVVTDADKAALGKFVEAIKSTISAPASATSGLAGYELEGTKKRDYSEADRKAMAAKGQAMKDGGFPIADAQDLDAAVKLYDNAKNKTAAKRFITRRARALKATDHLPEGWAGSTKKKSATAKAAEAAGLTKGLYLVSSLVNMLASMEDYEESYEQSGSYFRGYDPSPELTTRFGAILVDFGDLVADILDECLGGMKTEEAGEAMALAVRVVELAKVGARHSKTDQTMLQGIHDYAEKLGAACKTAKAAGDEPDLAKVTAERDALTKALTSVADQVSKIGERVAALERQPAEKGPRRYIVVDKSIDTGGDGGVAAARASTDDLLKNATPAQLADAAIRLSQQRGITIGPGGVMIQAGGG